jgi:hypothetical protein
MTDQPEHVADTPPEQAPPAAGDEDVPAGDSEQSPDPYIRRSAIEQLTGPGDEDD